MRLDPAELLQILASLVNVEAGTDALDPEAPTFTVKLTFSREKLYSYLGTRLHEFARTPTPTYLLDDIMACLEALGGFQNREESWAREEVKFGASIDDVIHFLDFEIQKRRMSKDTASVVEAKLYLNARDRLDQLRRRRAAGGAARTKAEQDRETDSKAWRHEEMYGDKRREEQQRQREKTSGRKDYGRGDYTKEEFTYNFSSDRPNFSRETFDAFHKMYEEAYRRTAEARSGTLGKKWWEVLGVSIKANADEIKKAARRLASLYHPDKHNGSPEMSRKMQEINAARDEGLGGL